MAHTQLPAPTVLVVEDEPITRILACDITGDAGFPFIEATDVAEALSAMEAESSIGIVFTDIDMPGRLNGLQMAHRIRELWPPVRFLVVSGQWPLAADALPAQSRFLSKPYDVAAITGALHRLAGEWRGLALGEPSAVGGGKRDEN